MASPTCTFGHVDLQPASYDTWNECQQIIRHILSYNDSLWVCLWPTRCFDHELLETHFIRELTLSLRRSHFLGMKQLSDHGTWIKWKLIQAQPVTSHAPVGATPMALIAASHGLMRQNEILLWLGVQVPSHEMHAAPTGTNLHDVASMSVASSTDLGPSAMQTYDSDAPDKCRNTTTSSTCT